ncbi:hypothetical protein HQ535_12830 [bacterium]|nr:hypothetical protein [bacterium]
MGAHSRLVAAMVVVGVIAAACGDGAAVSGTDGGDGASAAATVSTTQAASGSSAPASTSTTTTVAEPDPAGDLVIHQIILRYDGVSGAGTFEATVCNQGFEAVQGIHLAITANGTEALISVDDVIEAETCISYHDDTMDLPAYGVDQPSRVPVFAEVVAISGDPDGNNTLFEDIEVETITMTAPDGQLAAYRDCRASSNHRNCVGLVPYHPIPDEGEVMKVSGEFIAIAPAEFEQVAAFAIADNRNCATPMRNYLGIQGPPVIAGRVVVADDYSGGYAAPFVEIYSVQSYDEWQRLLGEMGWWWRDVIGGYCGNSHEMTHLLLGELPLPGWLNEGLATFMEDTDRSHDQTEQPVECRETGWYGWDMAVSADAEVPYRDLMVFDPDVFGIYYYYTGMCFWDYIEQEFGPEKVREIVRETVQYRDPRFNGCSDFTDTVLFIRDIVNPILGVDISSLTNERWGFDDTFTGCEDV